MNLLRLGKATVWSVVVILAAVLAVPVATPGAAQGRGAARPQVVMPDGPVRQIIRRNCTSCHGIDDYAFFALDKPGWQKLIETRHKEEKSSISDADRNVLLDWLVSKFGPDTKPFPRSYIPPEITTFFSDPEANRLIERACTSCHPLDRVNEARYPADRWRVVAIDMRERGARLTDEELERLVEWLGRVRGTNQSQ